MISTYYRFSVTRLFLGTLALIFAFSLTNVFAQGQASSDFNFAEYKAKAEKGDAEAQLIVGMCYSAGEGGVKQDDKEALKWLQMAAKQKNYQAMYVLSVYCMEGRGGIPKNEELGKKLLINASNGGFAEAQYEYASSLAEEKKMDEALPLMKKSADQGFVPAQTALGTYYVNMMKPGSKEHEEGLTLLSLAAAEGDLDAQMTLAGTLIDQKNVVAGVVWLEIAGMNGEKSIPDLIKNITLTPKDCYEISSAFFMGDGIIPKNYEKYKQWGERAVAQNNADAFFSLGVYYFGGYNHEQNLSKGIAYLTKAADQGNAEAQALLAIAYRNGRGVPQDYKKAIELLQKSAKQQNADAYKQLAFTSLFGLGITSKEETTQKLFEKAVEMKEPTSTIFMDYCKTNSISLENGPAIIKQLADSAKNGDATAQFLMAECFSDGYGMKMDEKGMVAYYTMAAKQNYAPALTALSWIYEMGIYVKENRETAIQLALRAANQGDHEALSYLATVGNVEVTENQTPASK